MSALSLLFNFDQVYDQLYEAYGALTRSEEYLEKLRAKHERYGAFRSGEGTIADITQRKKDHEERMYLKGLYERKEITLDSKTNKKLLQMYVDDLIKMSNPTEEEIQIVMNHNEITNEESVLD